MAYTLLPYLYRDSSNNKEHGMIGGVDGYL